MNAPIQAPRVKICPRCPEKGAQALENFYKRTDTKDGYQCMCKACVKLEDARRREERNKDRVVCACGRRVLKKGETDCSRCRTQLTEKTVSVDKCAGQQVGPWVILEVIETPSPGRGPTKTTYRCQCEHCSNEETLDAERIRYADKNKPKTCPGCPDRVRKREVEELAIADLRQRIRENEERQWRMASAYHSRSA